MGSSIEQQEGPSMTPVSTSKSRRCRPLGPALALAWMLAACLGSAAALAQADPAAQAAAAVQRVDGAFIRANAAKTPDWPTIGVDYAETRYSRLDQINAANVKDLGLAWSYNLESTRGVEATPVVVDGIM